MIKIRIETNEKLYGINTKVYLIYDDGSKQEIPNICKLVIDFEYNTISPKVYIEFYDNPIKLNKEFGAPYITKIEGILYEFIIK